MKDKELNIYQKLAKIRKQVAVLKKDTKGYGYTYVKEESILVGVTALMEKYGVSLIPKITPGSTMITPTTYKKTKSTAKGVMYEENVNEVLVHAEMEWVWVDDANPESQIVVPWVLVGQQSDASQAFGSALTYSSRYFLLKYFNIATSTDDPDAFRSKQKQAEAADDQVITTKIIDEIDKHVQSYMANNPDGRDNVVAIASKYVKDCDYTKIKDFVLAQKLLEDLSNNLTIDTAVTKEEEKNT